MRIVVWFWYLEQFAWGVVVGHGPPGAEVAIVVALEGDEGRRVIVYASQLHDSASINDSDPIPPGMTAAEALAFYIHAC